MTDGRMGSMAAMVKRSTRVVLALAVLIACIGCDQATKQIATHTLRGEPTRSFLADTVRLHYVQNPGGFLSLGSSLSPDARFWFFTVANTLFLLVLVWLLVARWRMPALPFVAICLLLAGGIGNLIDRVMHDGLVTDFLNVGIGPLRTGIFNVADMAVMGSAIALCFLFRNSSQPKAESETSTGPPA